MRCEPIHTQLSIYSWIFRWNIGTDSKGISYFIEFLPKMDGRLKTVEVEHNPTRRVKNPKRSGAKFDKKSKESKERWNINRRDNEKSAEKRNKIDRIDEESTENGRTNPSDGFRWIPLRMHTTHLPSRQQWHTHSSTFSFEKQFTVVAAEESFVSSLHCA